MKAKVILPVTLLGIGLPLVLICTISANPVTDTGQKKCYDNDQEITCPSPGQDFYGQDANYAPCNPHSYTDFGNGIVRDNITGLEWQKDTAAGNYTWEEALAYCQNLRLGGYSDWRLPTIKELSTLVDSSIPEPGATINSDYFPNTESYNYWSSTTYASQSYYAWYIFFYYGSAYYDNKLQHYDVRAVRGGQSTNNYIDNGDWTITDTSTGLMWEVKTDDDGPRDKDGVYTWQEAMLYCENLNLAGYNDWRLPNKNELLSIVDYSRHNPSIDPILFNTDPFDYWSSTTDVSQPYYAWCINFDRGYDYNSGKTVDYGYNMRVRAVRGDRRIDADEDGILNDGDYSGTPGDNPCIGGQTEHCDDNCRHYYNPDQQDTNEDGVGDVCDCDSDSDCGYCEKCENGSCVFAAGSPCTDDGNPCTDDTCDGAGICAHPDNNNLCDDNSICTENDTCSDGSCSGSPIECDDGNVCTDDSCDSFAGCRHSNNTALCDDGLFCTATDTCQEGICLGSGDPCVFPDICYEEVDRCFPGCIADDDCDGICNPGESYPQGCTGSDNCPYDDNPDQGDADENGIGDACERDWNITTVEADVVYRTFTSLALDSNDNPHISYYDVNIGLRYARFHEGNWYIETVEGTNCCISMTHASLALDSNDNPHISFYDRSTYELKYAHYDGEWHVETVDYGYVGEYNSLDLDSNDNPHISYYDKNSYDLKCAYYNDTWHIEIIDSDCIVSRQTSLVLDSNDNPHISYIDDRYSSNQGSLNYAYYDGIWHIRTVLLGTIGATSIALDSIGNPCISYSHSGLYYAYYNGMWHTNILVDRNGSVGGYNSLALDGNDNPHVSYYDFDNDDLKYAYYEGMWFVDVVDESGYVGEYTSLVLDSNGNPHISYYDDFENAIKYAASCKDDLDCDNTFDDGDNCPLKYNPNQEDADGDGLGDVCDPCLNDYDNDIDSDSVCSDIDNCRTIPNSLQVDSYPPQGNGIGDDCECEADFACDGDVDGSDASTFKTCFGRNSLYYPCNSVNPCSGDFLCDGDVDGTDAALFKQDFGRSQIQNPCPACIAGAEWCVYQ